MFTIWEHKRPKVPVLCYCGKKCFGSNHFFKYNLTMFKYSKRVLNDVESLSSKPFPKVVSLRPCNCNLPAFSVRTVMLAQSTDSGQLIAAAVIKLFHAMKLQVQDLRGVGIQVQLLEGHARQDSAGLRTRSIKEMLKERGVSSKAGNAGQCGASADRLLSSS